MIFGFRAGVTVNISVVWGVAPIVRCADGSGIAAGLSETSIPSLCARLPGVTSSLRLLGSMWLQEHAVRKRMNR